jgi:NADH-quinone oxidoreductase subunit N
MPAYYLEALTVTLGIFLLVAEAFIPSKSKTWVGLVAIVGLIGVLALTLRAIGPDDAAEGKEWANYALWNLYKYDATARFYKIIALVSAIFVLILAIDYRSVLSKFSGDHGKVEGTGEYYSLIVIATSAMMWMASAKNLAFLFVSLELLTVTFYILVAYMKRNVGSLEAGVKYLILGALSTGFLVYGIAWIYGATGTLDFAQITLAANFEGTPGTPLLFGVALVIIALGFKIGAAPMHFWIPDVYQGAPTPTTAFLSVGSKAAGFMALITFLAPFSHSPYAGKISSVLVILACATLIIGNFGAIPQNNFKRLLAYSSIANAGFILLAIAANRDGADGLSSAKIAAFYLASYLIMTMAAFFILNIIRVQSGSDNIDALDGLSKRNPILAVAATIIMASLAGVPLTVGFVGKFFVFQAALASHQWIPVIIAAIAASAGFYYYFKILRAIWWNTPNHKSPIPFDTSSIFSFALTFLTVAILVFGVWQQPLFNLLKNVR